MVRQNRQKLPQSSSRKDNGEETTKPLEARRKMIVAEALKRYEDENKIAKENGSERITFEDIVNKYHSWGYNWLTVHQLWKKRGRNKKDADKKDQHR